MYFSLLCVNPTLLSRQTISFDLWETSQHSELYHINSQIWRYTRHFYIPLSYKSKRLDGLKWWQLYRDMVTFFKLKLLVWSATRIKNTRAICSSLHTTVYTERSANRSRNQITQYHCYLPEVVNQYSITISLCNFISSNFRCEDLLI